MPQFTPQEIQAALAPITSLLGKSEKAQQKLTPGTWQHSMLRANIEALRIAHALVGGATVAPDQLAGAATTLAAMAQRAAQAQGKFAAGSAQHSLLRNRIAALRIAQGLAEAAAGTVAANDAT